MRSLKPYAALAALGMAIFPLGTMAVTTYRTTSSHAGCYSTGRLAGHRGSDLYADYIGLSSRNDVIPSRLCVDWDKRLVALWTAKENNHGDSRTVIATARQLISEYRTKDPGRMPIRQYETDASEDAHLLQTHLDWQQLGQHYRLTERKLKLLKQISSHIGGRSLVAYAMTELLPGRYNGAFNRDYFDFLLRHGGRRFVESIPAIHDGITSFGPFQFTPFAIYDAHGHQNGASKANHSLPSNLRIPGSVMRLRSDDHAKAAYLFAVSNLADLIASLNERELKTLERVWRTSDVDLVEYIATAHNKPAFARDAGRKWLWDKARLPYLGSTRPTGRIYATKTKNNWRALGHK